jgi:hypothetical protein
MSKKIVFEVSDELNSRLEKLMKEGQVATKKDLMNNALTMLEWAVKQRKEGLLIGKLDAKSDKFGELEMPILSNVSRDHN